MVRLLFRIAPAFDPVRVYGFVTSRDSYEREPVCVVAHAFAERLGFAFDTSRHRRPSEEPGGKRGAPVWVVTLPMWAAIIVASAAGHLRAYQLENEPTDPPRGYREGSGVPLATAWPPWLKTYGGTLAALRSRLVTDEQKRAFVAAFALRDGFDPHASSFLGYLLRGWDWIAESFAP